MRHIVEHDLTDLNQMRTVVDKAYESYTTMPETAEYNPQLTWLEDNQACINLTVMRKSIDVNFALLPNQVVIEAKLPLLWNAFSGKIKSILGEEVSKWVEKVKLGEV
jgi:hypothetical protein